MFANLENDKRTTQDAFGRPVFAAFPITIGGGISGRKSRAASSNIFSYTGYQYDPASGLMFAQARYYLPEVGRFVSEDRSRDGENWYVRCASNPFRYIDPDGYKLQIVGNSTYQKRVFNDLQRLTRDKLAMDKNGTINVVSSRKGNTKNSGTQLVRELVKNKHKATIKHQKNECSENPDCYTSGANGTGTNCEVLYDPNLDFTKILSKQTKGSTTKSQVALAHELIHGYHDMKGTADISDENGNTPSYERQTVGLGKKYGNTRTYKITENRIRKEQGDGQRYFY